MPAWLHTHATADIDHPALIRPLSNKTRLSGINQLVSMLCRRRPCTATPPCQGGECQFKQSTLFEMCRMPNLHPHPSVNEHQNNSDCPVLECLLMNPVLPPALQSTYQHPTVPAPYPSTCFAYPATPKRVIASRAEAAWPYAAACAATFSSPRLYYPLPYAYTVMDAQTSCYPTKAPRKHEEPTRTQHSQSRNIQSNSRTCQTQPT